MKRIITTILFAAISFYSYSQTTPPPKQWDKTYGGNSTDYLYSLAKTFDGGFILGGESVSGKTGDKSQSSRGGDDYWIVRTDFYGSKLWDKRFGGTSSDVLSCVIQTNDGGFLIGGYSYSTIGGDKTENSRGASDYWIVKTDSNGIKQWDKTYGGNGDDLLFALQQTTDSGYILGGYSVSDISGDKSENSRGQHDYWIIKLDKTGAKQWDKTYGGNDYDDLRAIYQTTDEGYILAGYSLSGAKRDKTDTSKGNNDYWIIKTDKTGAKQWDHSFGGDGADYLYSICPTTDGGFILGGESNSNISGDKTQGSQGSYDYWIVKITASGIKQWDKRFGGNAIDGLYSIQQTSDGGYIMNGVSSSFVGGDKTESVRGADDYWLVKTDATGNKLWDKTLGGNRSDEAYSVLQSSDGGIVAAGGSSSSISWDKSEDSRGSYDFWIIKLKDTSCASCTKPTGLATSNVTGTSAKLSWAADTCAVGYQYEWRKKGTTTWTTAQTAASSKIISNLSTNTTYQWRVIKACRIKPDTLTSGYTVGPEFTTLSFTAFRSPNTEVSTNVAVISGPAYGGRISCTIMPNPSKGNATLIVKGNNEKVKIKITDATGKLVWQTSTNESSITLPSAEFAAGIYNVQVISSSGVENIKFVKQ